MAVLEEQINRDAARIAELERVRLQFEQLTEFKQKWIASEVCFWNPCTTLSSYLACLSVCLSVCLSI